MEEKEDALPDNQLTTQSNTQIPQGAPDSEKSGPISPTSEKLTAEKVSQVTDAESAPKSSQESPNRDNRDLAPFTATVAGPTKGFCCSEYDSIDSRERTYDIHGNTLFIRPNLPSYKEVNPLFKGFNKIECIKKNPRRMQQLQQQQQQQPQQQQQQQQTQRERLLCPQINSDDSTCVYSSITTSKSSAQKRQSQSTKSSHCSRTQDSTSIAREKRLKSPCGNKKDVCRSRTSFGSSCSDSRNQLNDRFPIITVQTENTKQMLKIAKPKYVIEKEEIDQMNSNSEREGLSYPRKTRLRCWKTDPYKCKGPTRCNKTLKEVQEDNEKENLKRSKKCVPKTDENREFLTGLRNVHNKLSYSTKYRPTTLEETLKPWIKADNFGQTHINRETLHLPINPTKHCDSEFGALVSDRLYPGWRGSKPVRKFQYVLAPPEQTALKPAWNDNWHKDGSNVKNQGRTHYSTRSKHRQGEMI